MSGCCFKLLARIFERNREGFLPGRRRIEHRIIEYLLADRAETACTKFVGDGSIHNKFLDPFCDFQINTVHLEKLLVLLQDGVFRLRKDPQQGILVKGVKVSDDRKTAYDLRD